MRPTSFSTRPNRFLLLLLALGAFCLASLAGAQAADLEPSNEVTVAVTAEPDATETSTLWIDLQLADALDTDLPIEALAAPGTFLAAKSCTSTCGQRYWNCLQHVCGGNDSGSCASRCEQQFFSCISGC